MNSEDMRRDWNEWAGRARRVDPRAEQESDIWRLGVADAEMILADVASRIPSRQAALELGCGWGRLMRPMAAQFDEVWGVDISEAMLAKAEASLADLPNVQFRHNNGLDLAVCPNDTFDFCYSMFLFDCLPDESLVRSYLHETYRALKQGGIFKVQVAGVYARNPFRRLYESANTWHGVRFTVAQIAGLAEDAGFEVCSVYHAHTSQQLTTSANRDSAAEEQYRLWVVARKGPHMDAYEATYAALSHALVRLLPDGASVISPEPGMESYLRAVTGEALHLQSIYRSATGSEAIAQLERHRAEGGRLLFFTRSTAWWLESYPELADWLHTHAHVVHAEPAFRIFDVDPL